MVRARSCRAVQNRGQQLHSMIRIRARNAVPSRVSREPRAMLDGIRRRPAIVLLALLWIFYTVVPAHGREPKRRKEDYGQGLITEISAPEKEVLDAVETVVNSGIMQGSKEYNKDQ